MSMRCNFMLGHLSLTASTLSPAYDNSQDDSCNLSACMLELRANDTKTLMATDYTVVWF